MRRQKQLRKRYVNISCGWLADRSGEMIRRLANGEGRPIGQIETRSCKVLESILIKTKIPEPSI